MMNKKAKGIWNNKPFWCILIFGLAVLCSSIKVLVLPQGGSLTYFGLLILWLMTFIYGPRYGLIASVIFGFVRLGITYLTGEYINPNIWSIFSNILWRTVFSVLVDFYPNRKRKQILQLLKTNRYR